jgi:hypothetical protein
MSATHGGKGSRQRTVIDRQKFNENWDKIFGKKDLTEELKEDIIDIEIIEEDLK